MAWEKRGSGKFYYRSLRVRGQVVKQYIGNAEQGRQAAAADAAAKESRRQDARFRQEKSHALDDLVADLDEFDKLVDQLVTCQLLCGGWKKHHRQWRSSNGRTRSHNRDA
jgi:hypothetical protein